MAAVLYALRYKCKRAVFYALSDAASCDLYSPLLHLLSLRDLSYGSWVINQSDSNTPKQKNSIQSTTLQRATSLQQATHHSNKQHITPTSSTSPRQATSFPKQHDSQRNAPKATGLSVSGQVRRICRGRQKRRGYNTPQTFKLRPQHF